MQQKLKKEEEAKKEANRSKEQWQILFKEGRKEFEGRIITNPILIKIRLSKKMEECTFSMDDTIETVFRYVSCCCRDWFQNRYSKFDILQTFPLLTLNDRKDQSLGYIFKNAKEEVFVVQ